MGLRKQLEIILKTIFSNTLFHLIWLGCLFAFFYWHIESFAPIFKLLYGNPYVWLFTAGFWWVVCWLCTFGLNLIWPVLLLMFFKTERLKNPKQIIQFGDRFRRLNLSTPQVYKMNDTQQVWKNRIRGFFALPSPFGALLLVGAEVIDKLSFEELDTWICRQVVESKFYRFSRPGMTFFTYVPTAGLLGFFCGELYFQNFNALILAAFFAIVAFFFWAQFQIQRIHFIDFRSIRIYHLDPDTFFRGIEVTFKKTFSDKILALFGKPSIERRAEWFTYKVIGLTDDINSPRVPPLFYRFLIPTLPMLLIVLVNIVIDGTHRNKLSVEQIISALENKGDQAKLKLPKLLTGPVAAPGATVPATVPANATATVPPAVASTPATDATPATAVTSETSATAAAPAANEPAIAAQPATTTANTPVAAAEPVAAAPKAIDTPAEVVVVAPTKFAKPSEEYTIAKPQAGSSATLAAVQQARTIAESKKADELAIKNSEIPQKLPKKLDKIPEPPVAVSDLSRVIDTGDMRGIIRMLGKGTSLKNGDPRVGGATPLLLALRKGDLEMVYLLLILGSQFSEVDAAGKSALIYAMESPLPVQTVAYVLRGNININYILPDGTTALDWARKNAVNDVADLLAASGARSRAPAQIKK